MTECTFGFRHEIARLAVQDTVPPHRAAPLHARLLRVLEARTPEDETTLAHHAEGAADSGAVLRHATAAARRAVAVASHREAAAQYDGHAVVLGGRRRVRAELHDGLSTEYGLLDRWGDATLARETAIELWRAIREILHEATPADARLQPLARVPGREATAAAQAAVAILRQAGISVELARGRCLRLHAHGRWDSDESIALADEAILLSERLDLPDVLSDALNTRACCQFALGKPWQADLEKSLEVAQQAQAGVAAGRAFANLQAMCVGAMMFPQAERWYRLGTEFTGPRPADLRELPRGGPGLDTLEMTGRWDEATRLAQDRMRVPHLSPVNRLSTLITLGQLTARGDGNASTYLDAALEDGRTLDEAQYLVPIHLARAEAHWVERDLDAARAEAEQVRPHLDRVDPWVRGAAATWLPRLGLPGPAGDFAEPYATQLHGDVGRPWPHGRPWARRTRWRWPASTAPRGALAGRTGASRGARRRRRRGRRTPSDARGRGPGGAPGSACRDPREPGWPDPTGARGARRAAASRTNEGIAGRLFISAKTVTTTCRLRRPVQREHPGEARAGPRRQRVHTERPGRRRPARRGPGDERPGMWHHLATQENVEALRAAGRPSSARPRASRRGRVGDGPDERAARDPRGHPRVADRGRPTARWPAGVLVTAGGTREPLDSVRFLGNRSSGAWAPPWPTRPPPAAPGSPRSWPSPRPAGRRRGRRRRDHRRARTRDAGPGRRRRPDPDGGGRRGLPARQQAEGKRPRSGSWTLELEPTADIAAALGAARRDGQVRRFAAEMDVPSAGPARSSPARGWTSSS